MRNLFNKKMVTAVCLIATMAVSNNCTNLTNNLSTDPVNITNGDQVPMPQYISGVEASLIGVYEGDVARIAGMWAQYFDGEDRQYIGLGSYVTSGQDYDGEWGTIYNNIFANTKIIKQKAHKVNDHQSLAVAQALEAMSIGLAADLWGDVPFSEAAKYPTITTPKFDSQASVYAGAQVLLDSAIANFGLSGALDAKADFFFGANTGKWIRACHTVKARLYLHTRDYPNAITQAGLGIASAAENLKATHGAAYGQNYNLFYSFLTYDRSGYMAAGANTYLPNLLDVNGALGIYRGDANTSEVARLNYYFAPFAPYWGGLNDGASYDPNVVSLNEPGFSWGSKAKSGKYDGFFACDRSFNIASWEENQLILAEASMKNADPTTALNTLNNYRTTFLATGAFLGNSVGYMATTSGIGGPPVYAAYADTDFNPGGIANNGTDTHDQALLREILEERYISLYGQIEGWNDMRRTDNYLGIPMLPGKTDYPKRFVYSQIEVNTNPNVPKTGVGLYDKTPVWSTAY